MCHKIICYLMLALLWPATLPLHGQQTLTLEQCLALAEKNSLQLKASKAEVEQTRLLQGTAWEVDMAQLSLSQDPTSGGSPDNALMLSQSIALPTVYATRHRVLKANTQVAGQRLNLSRKQLTLDISNTYEEMVYSQEKLRWLQRQDSVLRRYVDVASTRYQAGEARQLEPLTAYKLQRENLLTIKQVQDEYQLLQLQLMSLINSPEPVVPADQQLLMMAPPAADYNFAATSEGQLMASELLQAATQVKEAKTGYLPHINLGLRHQLVFSGWDPYKLHRAKFADGNFMGFEIGVGIPLFYGATKAKVKAARKEQEVVGLRRQQAELQQSQQILALQKRYASALERLRIYQDKGLGEAAEVARIAQAAYESGDIGYVEYVNSLQESLSTRMAYIDALHQYNQAVIQWQHSLR